MRVVVTGRLRQREYEPADGGERTMYEVDAADVGPSLRHLAEGTVIMKRPGGGIRTNGP